MSGKLVPKLRVVRCPKCFLHLEESPGYDVYKCGGCGTTLQGKNKKSVDVNSKSSTQETNAAPRNALKQHSNGLKAKANTSSSRECYVDENVGRGKKLHENGECNGDQLVAFNFSDEELESESDMYNLSHRRLRVSNKSSHKTTHCEIEEINDENNEKSGLVGENSEVGNTGSDLNDGNMLLEGEKEELYSGLDGEDANNAKSTLVRENHEVEITGCNKAVEEDKGKLILEGAEEEEFNKSTPDGEDPNNDQSTLVAAKSESASTNKSSSYENLASGKGSILNITHTPGKLEEGMSDNPLSSDKQQKKPQTSIHHRFNGLRSVDKPDTTESNNPSSELSGTLGQFPNYTATRSSHANDGILSSFDGKDERFPIQHSDSSEKSRTRTFSNGVSEVRTRKGTGLVNGKHHVMKDSREHQKKVLESPNHGHPHWMRTKRDKLPPRMRIPFHQSGSHSRYEVGNSSNQLVQDDLYSSSTFLSPDSYEDTDQEKMKLLRMIHKLQNQLNRTRYMSRETNGKPSTGGVSYMGKHYSVYHSHDGIHEGRFSHSLDYPRCNGRCSQGVNWHQRHKLSRIPYSAEATIRAQYYGDHSCFHCCPQPQERHVLCKHEELCRFCQCQGPNFYSSHLSYPSTPQSFTRETKSDDQRYRAPKLKRYVREKKNLGKRHCKPVAGGAPFIICHKCLKLLKLPADFLLFKRAFHKLKCGGCSEVLKFSLQNGSHIVSFAPHAT